MTQHTPLPDEIKALKEAIESSLQNAEGQIGTRDWWTVTNASPLFDMDASMEHCDPQSSDFIAKATDSSLWLFTGVNDDNFPHLIKPTGWKIERFRSES